MLLKAGEPAMTLFEHLDTQLRALLESTGSEVAYLPGEMLFGPTGPEWSGIVRLGLIRVMSYFADGRSITHRSLGPGDVVGLASLVGASDPVSAQAVGRSVVLRFDSRVVRNLRKTSVEFANAMMRELHERLVQSTQDFHLRLRGSLNRRLALELIDHAGEHGRGDAISIPLTHEMLAESLDTSREVVTRHLSELARLGLVRQRGRGMIEVPDRMRLLGYAREAEP
jgi:CRP-like cAMP-binding protein